MSEQLFTLKKIAQMRALFELGPQENSASLTKALEELRRGALMDHSLTTSDEGALQAELYFDNEVTVTIREQGAGGVLQTTCSTDGGKATCHHQYAGWALLWWALGDDASYLRNMSPEIRDFCRDFQDLRNEEKKSSDKNLSSAAAARFESFSVIVEGRILGERGRALESHLPSLKQPLSLESAEGEGDPRDRSLRKLPAVFARPVSGRDTYYWSDTRQQGELASRVCYNFSDGVQVAAVDIMRHAYKDLVPTEFLPAPLVREVVDRPWPLLQKDKRDFVSADLEEVEGVMQNLLREITSAVRRKKQKLYVQMEGDSERGLEVKEVSAEVTRHLQWNFRFIDGDVLKSDVRLVDQESGQPYLILPEFALDVSAGRVVLFPWEMEFRQINRYMMGTLGNAYEELKPQFELRGAAAADLMLQYLRGRGVPVHVDGGTHRVPVGESHLQLHLSAEGSFYPLQVWKEHQFRSFGQSFVQVVTALSQGLAQFFAEEPKILASRSGSKREWDLKLLKHLGILQYVTLETLSWHFEGRLTDGSTCGRDQIFSALHNQAVNLLKSAGGHGLVGDTQLTELCSRSAMEHFQKYILELLRMLEKPEVMLLEEGEFLFEGSAERSFQVLYAILKHYALSSGGACFKKSRTSLLSKIFKGAAETDMALSEDEFQFVSPGKHPIPLGEAIMLLHPLTGAGVKLYLNGQNLVELDEDEFRVDFQLVTNLEEGLINWFELNPRFFLQGVEVDPGAFKNLGGGGVIEYNGRFYLVPPQQMPSLKRLEKFWARLQKGRPDKTKKTWSDKIYQVSKNLTLDLLAMRASGYKIRGDEEWNKLCLFYDGLSGPKDLLSLPETVKADLKTYQHEGVQWLHDLYTLKLGAILADDMGLGKTLQALAFLEYLRTREELGQVLIVVPSSLVYNWENEVQKFTPNLPLEIFTSKEQDRIAIKLESKIPQVVIVTYGLLMENQEHLSQYKWNVLIFDEAQNLKNITAKRTGSARMLDARFKMCLTGTPLENHYGEFYSLMDLVVPGSLGNYEDFRKDFVNTEVVQVDDVKDLRLRSKPLVLRRTKKEILSQLPEKQETKVSIAFEEKQKRIYRDIAMSYNEVIKEGLEESRNKGEVQLQMLTALLRLRQACSDPAALPKVSYERTPPKLEALMDSLTEIVESGESALVFTQFVQTLEHTERLLRAVKIPVFVLHGGVPTKQRQKLLREFDQLEGGGVMLMTLKTGGVGLNLTKASYVFHLEPWWNPAVENQATDRAHRLGQRKAVQVFRYIMHESLEEKMELLKERKKTKFQALFSDAESAAEVGKGSGALSKEDFAFLLGVKD